MVPSSYLDPINNLHFGLLESWHSFWRRQAYIFRSPDYLQNEVQTFHSGILYYFPPSILHSGNIGQKRNWWFREQDAVFFLRLKFLYFWGTRNRQESVGFLSSEGIRQRVNIKNTQFFIHCCILFATSCFKLQGSFSLCDAELGWNLSLKEGLLFCPHRARIPTYEK